jgi:hypothetical protein
MTTFEVSNLGRYGYMGGRGGQSLRDQSGALGGKLIQGTGIGAGIGMNGAMEEGSGEGEGEVGADGNVKIGRGSGHGHGHGHGRGHGVKRICGALAKAATGPLMQVLGLDRFTKGKALGGMKRAGREANPFDMGFVKVCPFSLYL